MPIIEEALIAMTAMVVGIVVPRVLAAIIPTAPETVRTEGMVSRKPQHSTQTGENIRQLVLMEAGICGVFIGEDCRAPRLHRSTASHSWF
jgi:hypothetical protein